eukprot:CAMPEP_0170539542 /NCGR_PEP_ID=MMETSP0209-20121228/104005_1 /TAXON_ID=665100 ORGANISM="Litonotus pictus, Strain P1" /NCGR_SAMPLE_ID=MMETSP0209 /ASSEMBLY_ACC=CAM_ASM_000301 /LENGTH=359 /DNA_ID=CAMNT_0010841517 /DNA_START=352 /DNA_END=1428 /DNA_ORIENTATION=-
MPKKVYLQKKTKIDNLIVKNSANINWVIESRLIPKNKQLKLLKFYYKLYEPLFKYQVTFYQKFKIRCFEAWREVVIEEKIEVLKELENIQEEIDIYSEKIVNYENNTDTIEDRIKTATVKGVQCDTCKGFLNPGYYDFNATSSIIKDETMTQINIIPKFEIQGFIKDKEGQQDENKDIVHELRSKGTNNFLLKTKFSERLKKMSTNKDEAEDYDCGDDEIIDYSEITKNIDLGKLNIAIHPNDINDLDKNQNQKDHIDYSKPQPMIALASPKANNFSLNYLSSNNNIQEKNEQSEEINKESEEFNLLKSNNSNHQEVIEEENEEDKEYLEYLMEEEEGILKKIKEEEEKSQQIGAEIQN